MWATIVGLLTSLKGWLAIFVGQFLAIGNVQRGLWWLLALFILDFVTGFIASVIEKKKAGIAPKVYFFESGRARDSLVKATGYCLFIIVVYALYDLFFDGKIGLPISTKSFTIVELAIGVCIGIESWSNIENMKRSGVDIVGTVQQAAKKLWQTFNIIKHG